MPPLLMALVFGQVVQKSPIVMWPAAKAIQFGVMTTYIQPEIESHMQFWENELKNTIYFGGDQFTAADIMMSFPVEAAQAFSNGFKDYPRVKAYLEKIRNREAYKKAIEVGGPIQLESRK